MSLHWLPELPGSGGAYANRDWPELGEQVVYATTHPITRDPWRARWFTTKNECDAWIAAHPHLGFLAVEHLFYNEDGS